MTDNDTNFDIIAPIYDSLASVVYGTALLRSQQFFLGSLANAGTVLVLGGGTGKFLSRLLKINPSCHVWYIDSSAAMIHLARQNVVGKIHFIHGTEDALPPEIKFDAAITFFYLDLFDGDTLTEIVKKINASLQPQACWLVADFVNKAGIWPQLLLRTMYRFFRWTCHIGARRLPDWQGALAAAGWDTTETKTFYSGFIQSDVFRRVS